MSESKTKNIERNRAPRVQISYDVEHYNSPTTIELPFVMGVMAGLAGASESREAKKPVRDRAFTDVDATSFPKFMESLAPRVKVQVRNALPRAEEGEGEGETELALDLTFRSMADFAPDRITDQIPQLAELMRMRRQLNELLGFMDGRADAEKRIANLLRDEPLLSRIAASAVDGSKES